MSDFEARSRHAADAMRREAEAIADTESALTGIQAVTPLATVDRRADGWSRRRLFSAGAIAIGTAAAVIGVAVVVNDEQVVIEPPATQPVVSTTATPTASTMPVATPATTALTVAPTSTDATSTSRAEDWVPTQPPPPEPPGADDVPYPMALTATDTSTRYRIEPEWAPRIDEGYVQTFSNADGSRSLYVQTIVPRPETIPEPSTTDIGPWDLFLGGSPDPIGLTLASGDIAVHIDSSWLDLDLEMVAAQLGPRAEGEPGWDLGDLPGGLEPVGEGYWWVGDTRSDLVVDADGRPISQLEVTTGVPGRYVPNGSESSSFPLAPLELADGQQIVDFDGERAMFTQGDDFVSLFWEYEPGVYVTLWSSYEWTPRRYIRHVRDTVMEWRELWDDATPLPPGGDCRAFNC